MKSKWTKIEDNSLFINHWRTKKELMEIFPNRSYAAIRIRISKFGLKNIRNWRCESKMDVLLYENHLSYYWNGFIFADGCLKKNRLVVGLAKKDKEHLTKLAIFLNTKLKESESCVYIACQDKFIIPQLKDKFDIQSRKTYNPPDFNLLKKMKLDYLLSLFIGFIDGDGSIVRQFKRTDVIIKFQIHSSWLPWLAQIHKILSKELNVLIKPPFINGRGYAYWNICNKDVHEKLKSIIKSYNLPVLERKWERIK